MMQTFYSKNWKDYELIDTGEGEKLERFGKYTFVRPLENAFWKKTVGKKEWESAVGRFYSSKEGAKPGWKFGSLPAGRQGKLERWQMDYKGLKFWAEPTPFRHLGFFPEQAAHWDFIETRIKNAGRTVKVLNLFGYTGVASLAALKAGGDVTHVDASKQILNWVKENQGLNPDLVNAPLRILEDDAIKFLEREIKRGNKYDAIMMDPPKFGRGPKGETWKIEKDLPKLLSLLPKVLSKDPIFVIATSYATDSSSLPLGYALKDTLEGFGGKVEQGELCLEEKSNKRLIPLANTAIWSI